jgi:hypothetical protein
MYYTRKSLSKNYCRTLGRTAPSLFVSRRFGLENSDVSILVGTTRSQKMKADAASRFRQRFDSDSSGILPDHSER